MDAQATKSDSEDKKPIEAIGYIEEMNNGRYYVSCGNEKSVDAYWYITEDT